MDDISFLKNKSKITTPTLMLASAKLKTGLKKTNSSPPTNGIHVGHVVSINGK
jgi:hypothetical protein